MYMKDTSSSDHGYLCDLRSNEGTRHMRLETLALTPVSYASCRSSSASELTRVQHEVRHILSIPHKRTSLHHQVYTKASLHSHRPATDTCALKPRTSFGMPFCSFPRSSMAAHTDI